MENTRQPLWLWTGGSALGALVGAVLALKFFPGAAFARNPTGQFSWHLVGFAFAVGIPLGLSQWLVLRHALKTQVTKNRLFLHLWIPITSVGIAAMIFPLWWFDAEMFALIPFLVVIPMFPGMILLGVTQWFLLHRLISARIIWVLLTVIGAVIGSVFGLILGLIGRSFFSIPLEITWSFVTGGSIGLLQAIGLISEFSVDRSDEKLVP